MIHRARVPHRREWRPAPPTPPRPAPRTSRAFPREKSSGRFALVVGRSPHLTPVYVRRSLLPLSALLCTALPVRTHHSYGPTRAAPPSLFSELKRVFVAICFLLPRLCKPRGGAESNRPRRSPSPRRLFFLLFTLARGHARTLGAYLRPYAWAGPSCASSLAHLIFFARRAWSTASESFSSGEPGGALLGRGVRGVRAPRRRGGFPRACSGRASSCGGTASHTRCTAWASRRGRGASAASL